MLKQIVFISALCVPLHAFAQDKLTKIDGSILYSVNYANPNAKFKGSIIFQNGAGTSLKEWTHNKIFLQCIKQLGNAFVYDRSGQGNSPPDFNMSSTKPMTAELVNSKLIKLLKINDIKSPYILVSHSYGGMYAGYFAKKYPDLVVGMLMIDPVPRDYLWSDQILKQYNIQNEKMDKLSSREAYELYSSLRSGKDNIMSAQDFYQIKGFDMTKEQLAKLPSMSNKIPIVIVSSTYFAKEAPIRGNWFNLQKQWLNQNRNSQIFKVLSGHFIQHDKPKLICEQLNKLVVIATKANDSKP